MKIKKIGETFIVEECENIDRNKCIMCEFYDTCNFRASNMGVYVSMIFLMMIGIIFFGILFYIMK